MSTTPMAAATSTALLVCGSFSTWILDSVWGVLHSIYGDLCGRAVFWRMLRVSGLEMAACFNTHEFVVLRAS